MVFDTVGEGYFVKTTVSTAVGVKDKIDVSGQTAGFVISRKIADHQTPAGCVKAGAKVVDTGCA